MKNPTCEQLRKWRDVCLENNIHEDVMFFKSFLSYFNSFKEKNGKSPTKKEIKNQFLKGCICLEKCAK